MAEPSQRESHYVQSLERGLSVITAFGPRRRRAHAVATSPGSPA